MALATENRENNMERWQAALAELKADPPLTPPDRTYGLNVVVAVDTSGSMDGARLNSVKIGLCCLLSALKDTDKVMVCTFSSSINMLTREPMNASALLPMLPALLTGMRADGMTKYFDAVLKCLDVAAQSFTQPGPGEETRTILVTLTDGEDTASDSAVEDVRLRLRSPGVNNLMFLAVTVDMSAGVLQTLESWFIYSHSKRIDVTVKTGRRLVGVFAETVLLRMLRDNEESALSFFSTARGVVLREGCVEPPPGQHIHRRFSDGDGAIAPAAPHPVAPHGTGLLGAVRGLLFRRSAAPANPGSVLDPTSVVGMDATGGVDDDDDDDAAVNTVRCSSPIFTRYDSCEEDN